MRERPILFSGEMVRAITDGKKSMTRRVVLLPNNAMDAAWIMCHCPYGQPGDRLWVRETWKTCRPDSFAVRFRSDNSTMIVPSHIPVEYGAPWSDGASWRPSIYMPRWASRLTLEVTAVRVEGLQDITNDDAMAEGVHAESGPVRGVSSLAAAQFAVLWDSINGNRPGCAWADNPWVWVVSFKRVNA